MATNAGTGETPTSTSTTDSTTGETQGQEQQGQQQGTAGETPGQEQQQASTPEKLPDDHPLVKTLAANKDKIASLTTELAEARAQAAKATKLETDLTARPTAEALTTLQNRYDRLEQFAQAVGIGKALDSRTFTKDLFESDKDIKTLVKEWNAANPSATATALGAGPATAANGTKGDMNTLLRAAMKQ